MGKRSEKIRNYNQLLLAVGGTLTFLFFLLMGIIILSQQIEYLFPNHDYIEDGILATEETDKLLTDSLRKQIISFKKISLIDSINKIYLLPVGQADLSEEEHVSGDLLGLTNSFSENNYHYRSTTFNNLVVYKTLGNESEIIFDERISISHYLIIQRENNVYLLITATDKDSNEDGYLNEDDLQGLYLYEVNKNSLTKIETKQKFTALDINKYYKTNDVICKFGLDKNDNGVFEYWQEPIIYYIFDFESKTLIKTVKDKQILKLQKLLEGR